MSDGSSGWQVREADLSEKLSRPATLGGLWEHARQARALASQGEIVGDGQIAGHHRLLRDQAYAQRFCSGGRRDAYLAAKNLNSPAVGTENACQNLGEGGLAGAVCPDQAMALASQNLHGHASEGLNSAEALADFAYA